MRTLNKGHDSRRAVEHPRLGTVSTGSSVGLEYCFHEMYCYTPYHAMFGRAPRIALSALASSVGQDGQMDVLDEKALRAKVQNVVAPQSQLHKEVLDMVQANRGKQRAAASRGNLTNFVVGDYVLVAWVQGGGSTLNLLMAWTEPWRVVVAQRLHVYGVQNIVSGEVRDVHLARMRFYAAPEITAE